MLSSVRKGHGFVSLNASLMEQAELNYSSSLLDTICPPWPTLPAITNPSQECTMKLTREVLEQVEGRGAMSLQMYLMKDLKKTEAQYAGTFHCSVALNLQLDKVFNYVIIDVM